MGLFCKADIFLFFTLNEFQIFTIFVSDISKKENLRQTQGLCDETLRIYKMFDCQQELFSEISKVIVQVKCVTLNVNHARVVSNSAGVV